MENAFLQSAHWPPATTLRGPHAQPLDERTSRNRHALEVFSLKPLCRRELEFVECRSTSLDTGNVTPVANLDASSDSDVSAAKNASNLNVSISNASTWIVFDPVSRSSFRIGEFEYWLLRSCDGETTIRQLTQLAKQKTNSKDFESRVVNTIANGYRTGLISRNVRAEQIWGTSQVGRTGWSQWSTRLVVWRLPGINLDRQLQWLSSRTDWLYGRRAVVHSLVCLVLTCMLLLLNAGALFREATVWNWLARLDSGVSMLVVFLASRAAHELGHAIVCRRHGVRCPDMGILLVLGTPCLYCDVSESWRLPRRANRAAIAAAGIYTEICLAMAASWIWMFTHEGPVHTMALQTMIVCSVSTLLVNANPLMRFDGYYILADWLDEVNLRQKADQTALQWTKSILLGSSPAKVGKPSMKTLGYTLFSAASGTYRWILMFTIAATLMNLYGQWQLPWVGRALAVLMIATYATNWILGWWKQLAHAADSRVQKWRFRATVVGFLVCVLFTPLPQRTFLSGWTRPSISQGVFAPEDGVLVDCAAADQQPIEVEETLFELSNPELVSISVQRDADLQKAIAAVEFATATNTRIAEVQESKTIAEDSASRARARMASLIIRSSAAGYFLPALAIPSRSLSNGSTRSRSDSVESFSTRQWSSKEQIGRRVVKGTLLGKIQSRESIAVLPLIGSQLGQVAEGMEVKIRIPSQRFRTLSAQIERVVNLTDDSSSNSTRTNLFDNSMNSETSATQGLGPQHGAATYHEFAAIVRLPEELRIRSGASVDAVVKTPPLSLAGLSWKWIRSNIELLAD